MLKPADSNTCISFMNIIYIYQTLLSKATYSAFRLYIYCQYVCFLGIEPTTFALMLYHWATGTSCSTCTDIQTCFKCLGSLCTTIHRCIRIYSSLCSSSVCSSRASDPGEEKLAYTSALYPQRLWDLQGTTWTSTERVELLQNTLNNVMTCVLFSGHY